MIGLVIFLGIVLALFVTAAIVLVALIISVSRKISRTQQQVRTVRQNIGDLTNVISTGSSVAALLGTAAGAVQNIRKRVQRRRADHGKKDS